MRTMFFAVTVSFVLITSTTFGQDHQPGPRAEMAWDEARSASPPPAPGEHARPGMPPPPESGPWAVPVPPPPPGAPGGPPGFVPGGEPGRHWDPLLRLLAQRRPHLAERLTELRDRDPERFQEVLATALATRFERALDELDAGAADRPPPEPPQARRSRSPGPPEWQRGPRRPEVNEQVRGLQEQQDKLEQKSRELARQYRRSVREQAPPADIQTLRDELQRTLNQQFELRTELRITELEHLERDLQRIQERLETLRINLERRQAERAGIVERRIEQLLNEESSGW